MYKKGVRNIILTSGTLEPLNTFENEIGLEFKIKLTNKHILNTKVILNLLD